MRAIHLLLPVVALVTNAIAGGCSRPVDGRRLGATILSEVRVEPSFAREGIPIDISFRAIGAPPARVRYEISGQRSECTPEKTSDGRLHCTHPGLNRDVYPQGNGLVVVETQDEDGKSSVATGQITIDFDCPKILAASINPPIAAPGLTVSVFVEVSELLRESPSVTRLGRSFGTAAGQGRSYTVTHLVSANDPPSPPPGAPETGDLVIRAVDVAGNRTGDCGQDVAIPFAVDHNPPSLDPERISFARDVAGLPSTLTASAGAVMDDVGVDQVQVLDESGTTVLTVRPAADGSIPASSVSIRPTSRVKLVAIDRFGRTSDPRAVRERWRLSIGDGASPGSAIKTGTRFSPPPAHTRSLHDLTAELAPDLRSADARSAVVRSRVGFEVVGQLPPYYQDRYLMASGYDPAGDAIVMFGGQKLTDIQNNDLLFEYSDRTTVLRWDEIAGVYQAESGPAADWEAGRTPFPRNGMRLAFNEHGCGVMFGGEGLLPQRPGDDFFQIGMNNDVWRICTSSVGEGYRWERIRPDNGNGSFPQRRLSALEYDPMSDRYVVVGGAGGGPGFPIGDVLFLYPNADPARWHWTELTQLPTSFGQRSAHILFFDPRINGLVIALGFTLPYDQESVAWTYWEGQWTGSTVPTELRGRRGLSYDYDRARKVLAFWGDNYLTAPDPHVWILAGTSTQGPSAWRRVPIDPPVDRAWPSVVYDRAREQLVGFSGVKFIDFDNDPNTTATIDRGAVPRDVYGITLEPAWPVLQATIDLGATRPTGIGKLVLTVRGNAIGDADGTGPGSGQGRGVEVMLWDHGAGSWVRAGRVTATDQRGTEEIRVELSEQPERFVGPEGLVPVTIRGVQPATESVEARLAVDVIDGWLELRP